MQIDLVYPDEFQRIIGRALKLFMEIQYSKYNFINFICIDEWEDIAIKLYLDDFQYEYTTKDENDGFLFMRHFSVKNKF